jgi:hypothetical protein
MSNKNGRNNSVYSPLNRYLENNNDITGDKTEEGLDTSLENRKKKRISLGSISKVFSRGKTRRSLAMSNEAETDGKIILIS